MCSPIDFLATLGYLCLIWGLIEWMWDERKAIYQILTLAKYRRGK